MPSLWREAFGLVALEAALRGIPVLSTSHGGLVEANPLRELCIPSLLVADTRRCAVHCGSEIDDFERRHMRGAVEKRCEPECTVRLSTAKLCLLAAQAAASRTTNAVSSDALTAAAMAATRLVPPLREISPSDLLEGGWHGPARADVAPVPGFRKALVRLFEDEEHLRHVSRKARERSRSYVASRRDRLKQTLLALVRGVARGVESL